MTSDEGAEMTGEHADRQRRVDLAIARQLGDAIAENCRLRNRLDEVIKLAREVLETDGDLAASNRLHDAIHKGQGG